MPDRDWPTQIEYQDAVARPASAFSDRTLQAGTPADLLPFGLPRPITGQFANVYALNCPGPLTLAVRLFLSPSPDRAARYAVLRAHVTSLPPERRQALVRFAYQAAGISVRGAAYPLVLMDWAAGVPLHEFVERHLYDSARLSRLADQWRAVVEALRMARIAHGDLQHGNILVESGTDGAPDTIRLIDYDGMWVPALHGWVGQENGHVAFQHRERATHDFGPRMDRFSALVIHASLRVVAVAPELWFRLHDGDNLLFRREDFQDPETGRAFSTLKDSLRAHRETAALVRQLKAAASGPLTGVPELER